MATSSFVRTTITHPLQLAVARKRVTKEAAAPSLFRIVKEAYSGNAASSTGLVSGIRNIYRGYGVALLGNVMGEISYLWTLEAVREELRHSSALVDSRDVVAGVAGDCVAVLLCTPLGVVFSRQVTAGYGMTTANHYRPAASTFAECWELNQSSSSAGVTRSLRVQRGLRGIYAGVSAGAAMIPASGVWWGLYGQVKHLFYALAAPILRDPAHQSTADGRVSLVSTNWLLSSTDNPAINGAAGVVASVLTTMLYNPVMVVRTRLQTLPVVALAEGVKRRRRVHEICSSLVKEEGYRGFFKGSTVNVGVAVLDGLMFSFLYELTKLSSDRGVAFSS